MLQTLILFFGICIVFHKLFFLLLDFTKYSKGIQLLEKIILINPSDLQSYLELGEFYFLNDQIEEAKILWKNGFDLFNYSQSYFRLIITVYGRFGLDSEIEYLLIEGRKRFGDTFLTYETGIYYQNRNVFDKAMNEFVNQITNEID